MFGSLRFAINNVIRTGYFWERYHDMPYYIKCIYNGNDMLELFL